MRCNKDIKLGPNGKEIIKFVNSLKDVNWLSNIGLSHPRDREVIRVYSWDEAEMVANNGIMECIDESKREELGKLAKRSDRIDYINEYIDYAISNSRSESPMYTKIRWAISADREGAIYEIALADLGKFHYYLDLFDWYKDGHWPCGLTKDKKLIVF